MDVDLKGVREFSIDSSKEGEITVFCGWKKRSENNGNEFIMLNYSGRTKLLVDKGEGLVVRPDCNSRYDKDVIKKMKRVFLDYKKDVKSTLGVAGA